MPLLRRTFMITPIFDDHRVRRAAESDVDVIVLDLEDGVHHTRKAEAREHVAHLLRTVDWHGHEVIVRCNAMNTEHGAADVRAVAPAGPVALMLAKCDDASEPQEAAAILAELEPDPANPIRLWCFVESAMGLLNVEKIAFAHPRMEALVLGTGDLGADMNLNVRRITLSGDEGVRDEYLFAQGRVVAACRAARISPTSGVPVRTGDVEGAFTEAERMFRLGFDTLGIVTPRVVDAVHRAYRPSDEDIEWARATVSAQDTQDQGGITFGLVDGAMVDGPHFRGARHILAKLKAIEEADARRAAIRAAVAA
jgi:citrate lyase subunit beta/citryl-CoA lyase